MIWHLHQVEELTESAIPADKGIVYIDYKNNGTDLKPAQNALILSNHS